jgi:hypothetical protein
LPEINAFRRARHVLRTRLSEHPGLYLPIARRRYPGPSPEVIGPDTELVIDGYTRSATTFAVYALQLPQPHPVRLAHHLHAPAQLIEAAKRQIPALALIREPQGAVLSHLVREPWVDMRDAADGYSRFYGCLMRHRSAFVVGEFEEVTKDFGRVARRLNARFGLELVEFEPTETNLNQCFELIRERPQLSTALLGFESGTVTFDELQEARRRSGPSAAGSPRSGEDTDSWVPSTERSQVKESLRERWLGPSMQARRRRAEAAYRDFVGEPTVA